MKKVKIERIISGLLKQYGYNGKEEDYLDIVSFIRSLGFNVGNAKLAENEDGFIAIRPRSTTMIAVNRDREFERKRFLIAHMFAHSVLHYKIGFLYFHREQGTEESEMKREADYFAAALLMPRVSFSRKFEELKKEELSGNALFLQLASIYKVPWEYVPNRIEEVEILSCNSRKPQATNVDCG